MSDSYGLLAPFYHPISRLVFGQDLIYANQAFLEGIIGKKLLIIGGGDGVAYRVFKGDLQGEFWDLSPRMTQLARKNLDGSKVLIHSGAWPGTGKFDRIYLPFVLDTMTEDEIALLLLKIRNALLPQGEVVVSDFFEPVTFRQKVLQKVMIGFFRIFTTHQRDDLPDLKKILEEKGFAIIKEKKWRKGWIRAQVWELK